MPVAPSRPNASVTHGRFFALWSKGPDLPDDRELLGLTLYRMGKWREAIDQLEVFAYRPIRPSSTRCSPTATAPSVAGTMSRQCGTNSVPPRRAARSSPRAGSYSPAVRPIRATSSGHPNVGVRLEVAKRPGGHHLRRAYALADFYDRPQGGAGARALQVDRRPRPAIRGREDPGSSSARRCCYPPLHVRSNDFPLHDAAPSAEPKGELESRSRWIRTNLVVVVLNAC